MMGMLWLQQEEAAARQLEPSFTLLPASRGPSPGAWAISVTLHLASVPLLLTLGDWLPQPPPQFVAERQQRREAPPIIFWVPPQARIVRQAAAAPKAPVRRDGLGQVRRGSQPPASPPPSPALPRVLSLPPVRAAARELLLVFPVPEIRDQRTIRQLPSVAVWTGARPPPPEVLTPGSVKPVPPAPPPDVTPTLAAPVPEAAPAEISIARPRPATSRLTLPPASATPMTMPAFEEPAALAPLPGETQSGIPVSVIAITGTDPVPGKSFTVPQSLSLGFAPVQAAAEETRAGAEPALDSRPGPLSNAPRPPVAQSSTPGRNENGTSTLKIPATASAASGGSGSGSGGPLKSDGSSAAPVNGSAQPSAARPLRTFTIPTNLGAVQASDWGDGSRRLSYPENGAFDIVVLGAGLPAGLPAPETLLKGRPIYTTYIQVGLSRDWILQFCLDQPRQTAAKRSGMVVNLGAEPRLEAPYVRFAAIPLIGLDGDGKYLVYYFRITTEGKVRDIRLVSGSVEKQATLTSLLESWRFRAAMRGGQAMPLEAVLLVPPGSFGK